MHFSPEVMCKRKSNPLSFNVSVNEILIHWDFDLSSVSPLAPKKEKPLTAH